MQRDALLGQDHQQTGFAICDSSDAMLSTRPYSPPQEIKDALAELQHCAGTQFDPLIVPLRDYRSSGEDTRFARQARATARRS
jgi:HD-GYP domain-containing protein (c-di-GMP phosphodiesterase class II)